MERRIADLLGEALNHPDYDKRINFLLAGLLSADANDTPEKEEINMGYLKEIYDFCITYMGMGDKKEYIDRVSERIKEYLE